MDWNKHYDNQLKGLLPPQPYYVVPKKMVGYGDIGIAKPSEGEVARAKLRMENNKMLQIPPKPLQQINPESSTVYKQKKPRLSKIKKSTQKKKRKKKSVKKKKKKKNKKVKKVLKKTSTKKRSKSINKSSTSKKSHSKLRGSKCKEPIQAATTFLNYKIATTKKQYILYST